MKPNENNPLNSNPNEFGLPEGYFQRSAGAIFNKIEWQEEHKVFPTLMKLKGQSGFTVPAHYFENGSWTELLDTPTLAALRKTNPFTVPEDYFISSEASLAGQLTEDGELALFNTLRSVPKQNPFTTADDYFTQNHGHLAALMQPQKQARRIALFTPKLWYAAAAVMLLVLGAWLYNMYSQPETSADCGTIACLDKNDLIKTKTLENLDNEELYELVNSKKLEEHLGSGETKNNKSKEIKKTDSSASREAVEDLPEGI